MSCTGQREHGVVLLLSSSRHVKGLSVGSWSCDFNPVAEHDVFFRANGHRLGPDLGFQVIQIVRVSTHPGEIGLAVVNGRKITPNLPHLDARMRQSGHSRGESITPETLTGVLKKRFAEVNFQEAAEEVRVFLHDGREVECWSTDFFVDLAAHIPTVQNY